jgi:hypothetical protein
VVFGLLVVGCTGDGSDAQRPQSTTSSSTSTTVRTGLKGELWVGCGQGLTEQGLCRLRLRDLRLQPIAPPDIKLGELAGGDPLVIEAAGPGGLGRLWTVTIANGEARLHLIKEIDVGHNATVQPNGDLLYRTPIDPNNNNEVRLKPTNGADAPVAHVPSGPVDSPRLLSDGSVLLLEHGLPYYDQDSSAELVRYFPDGRRAAAPIADAGDVPLTLFPNGDLLAISWSLDPDDVSGQMRTTIHRLDHALNGTRAPLADLKGWNPLAWLDPSTLVVSRLHVNAKDDTADRSDIAVAKAPDFTPRRLGTFRIGIYGGVLAEGNG